MKIPNLIILSVILLYVSCASDKSFDAGVRKAVETQMEKYPRSTLRDIYKNFFQDRFGPGHLINDVSSAHDYLHAEIDSYDGFSGELAEPTGWKHNFYRVNLAVVKSGLVSCDDLLDALVRSADGVEPVTVREWKAEWLRIEAVISAMRLSLPDYEQDLNYINAMLEEGNYVGHHSDAYNTAYEPHYRIISREIYENEILPLLELPTNPK